MALSTTALLPAIIAPKPRWSSFLVFGVLSTVGFLSHLSYLTVFTAQLAWCGLRLFVSGNIAKANRGAVLTRIIGRWFALAVLPVVVVGLLWCIDLRFARVGGSSLREPFDVVREFLASIAGLQDPAEVALATAGITLAVIVSGLITLARAKSALASYPFAVLPGRDRVWIDHAGSREIRTRQLSVRRPRHQPGHPVRTRTQWTRVAATFPRGVNGDRSADRGRSRRGPSSGMDSALAGSRISGAVPDRQCPGVESLLS
jgi:hypothetical protein